MVMPNPPATQSDINAIVNVVHDFLELADEVSDAAVVLGTEFGGLSAACIARAAQALMSVAELAQRGFVGDSMSVARTVVELTIDLGYIASDPNTLTSRFVGYRIVRNRAIAEALAELHRGAVDEEAMRILRERAEAYIGNDPQSEWSWAAVGKQKRGLGWRAARVAGSDVIRNQYVQLYELLYAEMCGASHSGQATLDYVIQDGNIAFGPQAPSSRPIRLALLALAQMIRGVLQACAIVGFDERLLRCSDALLAPTPPPAAPHD